MFLSSHSKCSCQFLLIANVLVKVTWEEMLLLLIKVEYLELDRHVPTHVDVGAFYELQTLLQPHPEVSIGLF